MVRLLQEGEFVSFNPYPFEEGGGEAHLGSLACRGFYEPFRVRVLVVVGDRPAAISAQRLGPRMAIRMDVSVIVEKTRPR